MKRDEEYYWKDATSSLATVENCVTKFRSIMETYRKKVQTLKYLYTFHPTIRYLYINSRNRGVNSLRRCRELFLQPGFIERNPSERVLNRMTPRKTQDNVSKEKSKNIFRTRSRFHTKKERDPCIGTDRKKENKRERERKRKREKEDDPYSIRRRAEPHHEWQTYAAKG